MKTLCPSPRWIYALLFSVLSWAAASTATAQTVHPSTCSWPGNYSATGLPAGLSLDSEFGHGIAHGSGSEPRYFPGPDCVELHRRGSDIHRAADTDGGGSAAAACRGVQGFFNADAGEPGADPDGDGAVNLMEYLMGTDPTIMEGRRTLPEPQRDHAGRLRVPLPLADGMEGNVILRAEFADDPGFASGLVSMGEAGATTSATGEGSRSWTFADPAGHARRFGRIVVSLSPE